MNDLAEQGSSRQRRGRVPVQIQRLRRAVPELRRSVIEWDCLEDQPRMDTNSHEGLGTRILFVPGFVLRASSDIRVDSCPFVVRQIALGFCRYDNVNGRTSRLQATPIGAAASIRGTWLGVPEPGR
jgi:hypothetical protein